MTIGFFCYKIEKMPAYNFKKIEGKWQKIWAKNKYKIWAAFDFSNKPQAKKLKSYVLDMFPYPSGEGLHVGHVEGYTASDITSRFLRMNGYNVLHPMGWDAFGLPAENYAIKTKTHPSKVVARNVKRFKQQLKSLGFSYDWQREINTTDPDYYKWTQWIFIQLFKKGLAYEAELPVNWCVSCKTVLANEEVVDGACDRCQSRVERRNLKQWVLKITAYADRLLEDLDRLDWPERVKEMQRNWIGRSEGRLISFPVDNSQYAIEVFTTKPDTIDGTTYVVLAPEHPAIPYLKAKIKNWQEVAGYIADTENKSERDRIAEAREKTGVELKGVKAVNPYNNEKISVWISDYVLIHYGTGAIMAVPRHDERDKEFATKFNLPIKDVPFVPKEKWIGEKKINYKLRDWIFSRQRYWGEPIPIIKCVKCGNIPVPEEDLPIELPKIKKYEPTGKAESPLAAIKKWVNVKCPQCKGPAKRETNTMPQWAGSNWYHLAYLLGSQKSKGKSQNYWNKKILDYWLPVDIYVGGVEHAVLHLLYARFWHKFLYDIGVVSDKEPFTKLVNQGLILGPDGQKMSKSRGNVVNPDDMVKSFGADSLRLYEMFMGPLEDPKPWDPRGIIGLHRFLNKVWNLIIDRNQMKDSRQSKIPLNLDRLIHQTIKKVTEDIQNFRFNTAISALMILVNEMEKASQLPIAKRQLLIKLLSPFAPHIAQELWQKLGGKNLLDFEEWPKWDEKMIQEEEFDLIIQVNGKFRAALRVKKEISESEAKKLALNNETIKKWLIGKEIKKVIFVPNRLINLIV